MTDSVFIALTTVAASAISAGALLLSQYITANSAFRMKELELMMNARLASFNGLFNAGSALFPNTPDHVRDNAFRAAIQSALLFAPGSLVPILQKLSEDFETAWLAGNAPAAFAAWKTHQSEITGLIRREMPRGP